MNTNNRTYNVNQTDTGWVCGGAITPQKKEQIHVGSSGRTHSGSGRSLMGADSPKTDQKQESQYDPIDLYCIICFTPFSNEEYLDVIANGIRQGNVALGQEQCEVQKSYYLKTKYIHENCGVHKGKLSLYEPLVIQCLGGTEGVGNCIELAKNSIRHIIYDEMSDPIFDIAPARTLHLLVYCFDDTEDIANCFLCSTQSGFNIRKEWYPETGNRCSQYVSFGDLARIAFDFGVVLQIEYVQVFSTQESFQPMDQRIVELLDELYSENTESWETTKDKQKDVYLVYWCYKSADIHEFCEVGVLKCEHIGYLSISLAVACWAGVLIAPVTAPIGAFIFSVVADTTSKIGGALKVVDGVTYLKDGAVFEDYPFLQKDAENAYRSGKIILLSSAKQLAVTTFLKGTIHEKYPDNKALDDITDYFLALVPEIVNFGKPVEFNYNRFPETWHPGGNRNEIQ